ncbi:hypothetical protein C1645_883037 [Glomus cerebriforme]|uniref:G-protein coupled receptors family 1 profile domain-containing protein n=1 Tax=Glomus cerebriforme TaxID=658196 RepID=A0A397RX53_9GLOM|nr:hypothetical protein C1645_883037 [Glomus cerebriforme]
MITNIVPLMFSISCLGNLCVFYRTFKQLVWNFNKERLKMVYKLPFYTSLIDFIENVLFLANILHTAIYASVFEEPTCSYFSMILWAFDTMNLSLYVVISVITYLRICCNCTRLSYFGNYDYKLWIPTLVLSSIFQLINMHNHGPRKYWCSGKSGQITSSILSFCFIIITLITMLFCYVNVLREMNRVFVIRNEPEKKAAKKITSYMIVFIIRWIPIMVQTIGRFLNVKIFILFYFLFNSEI